MLRAKASRTKSDPEFLRYYLNLLEAVQRCGISNPEPDLAVLLPDYGDFPARRFG